MIEKTAKMVGKAQTAMVIVTGATAVGHAGWNGGALIGTLTFGPLGGAIGMVVGGALGAALGAFGVAGAVKLAGS